MGFLHCIERLCYYQTVIGRRIVYKKVKPKENEPNGQVSEPSDGKRSGNTGR